MPVHPRTRALGAALALSLALAGCGGGTDDDAEAREGGAEETENAPAAGSLGLDDPWIKAATIEDGMTAVFGALVNEGDTEVTVVAASHEDAETVELHEVTTQGADATMSEREGGFPVPANGTLQLEPGGDHIMLMGLTADLEPGAESTVTVELSDGSTTTFTAVVKEHAGANEEYEGDHEEHGGDH
ncbi:copper chaperone PCu(A)C [Nocardiopsis sp. JB363]|uniref:copper chaperone PCu(A)C n=1 Tax=Nocardiopsis sp. JB363 TaxID=1434837 RepID=UPI00097ABDE1|nr:copper chaperone PCu(A)C [Nocardiopsis sp. JB363]SIO87297.1 Copper metallochaperone, bacterial analog of Cox17 protein [Nocardiopsis sp. JB363]